MRSLAGADAPSRRAQNASKKEEAGDDDAEEEE
jgi:hypothetical protein